MTSKKQTPDLYIRWMIRRDMADVLEIEASAHDFHWNEDVFLYHLRQKNVIGMVAECEDVTLGFMVYSLQKSRLQLLNFVVDPRWRRLGVGGKMVARLVKNLSTHRRTHVVCNVHEGNLEMQLFMRATGFRCEGVVGDFYIMARGMREEACPAPSNRIAAFME